MSEVAEVQQPRLPALHAGNRVQAIVPNDFEGAWRIANAVVKAGMAPKGLDTPEKAMVAIMHGLEVGLTPMNALQSIAVINSRATLWGDGALGLVQASGKMESHKEWFEGQGEQRKALCLVKRRGDPEAKLGEFSVADARKAGLWDKAGPWKQYSDRMLKMRARAFALRDGFSDVLRGLGIAEEVQDIHEMRDVTPASPPSPPSASSPPAAPQEIHVRASKQAQRKVLEEAPPPVSDNSTSKEGEASSEAGAPAAGFDVIDPDKWLDDITSRMRQAESVQLLDEIWEADGLPHEGDISPPAFEEAQIVYEERKENLEGAG